MTQEARYPNKLKALLTQAGYSQRELSRESDIPEGTFRHYASGDCIIPNRHRVTLARLLGCDVQDLEPQTVIYMTEHKKETLAPIEFDGHFVFGSIKTSAMVLDGYGSEVYYPNHIRTHYDPQPATFFEEILRAKEQIQREQEEKQRNGEPYQWNGEKYHLSRIVISREPVHESMTLGLWLKPRDHFTGLATRRCLDDPTFRLKYGIDEHDWSGPIVGMSCSLGVDITVISADGYAFFSQRGQHQSVNQNKLHTSISEAINPTLDRSATGREPDVYKCAARGISEELGLAESVDFSLQDIQFLSFSVDTHYALYGLKGMVHVRKSAKDIMRCWQSGVKDKIENAQLIPVPFTPQDICAFVFAHGPCSGLVCIYHTLVHEFGREQVDATLAAYE